MSEDHSPPRRQIFFPVVIATVFLTILAMIAGFLLGERSRARDRASAQQQPQQQQQSPQQPAPQASPATPGRVESSPTPRGPACPRAALQTAARLGLPTDLRQVFKIQTKNGTTVWICGDPDGGLYYQSKTGGLDAELVQKKNGLFLYGVSEQGEHEYRAEADNGNAFLVDEKQLVIQFADGRVDEYAVIASE